MKIRNLSKVALAIAISSAVVLEGCKKYDDDISRLEQSINQNTSDIAALKTSLASFASNMVVQSVTSVAGGFDIVFKKPDGTTVPFQIRNGAAGKDGTNGTNGKDGTNGTNGKDGAPGTIWQINTTTNTWESSNDSGKTWTSTGIKAKGQDGTNGKDGQDGTNGQDGANGKDGQDGATGAAGKDGSVVTIEKVGDKHFWHIDGQNTNVQAYPGDVSIVATDGGYNAVFTDSNGDASTIFLSKEKNAITSISLLPVFTENNIPVLTFPRIVESTSNRATLMQGSGLITYKLNPFGVNPDFYKVDGLVSQTTTDAPVFRSSGDALAPFTISTISKTFSEVTIAATPNNGNPFPAHGGTTNLHLALRIENTKADGIAGNTGNKRNLVVSKYDMAKEEIVYLNEVTIERHDKTPDGKIVTPQSDFGGLGSNPNFFTNGAHNNQLNTLVGTSNATASGINQDISNSAITAKSMPTFKLNIYEDATREIQGKLPNNLSSYSYRGGIDLNKELKGFFVRNFATPQLISMDDNGLGGYSYKFSKVSYGTGGNDFADDIVLNNGHISVAETTPGEYNSAAAVGNRTPIVKVDMYAPNGTTLLATRFVKIALVNTPATPVSVMGAASFDMNNNGANILAGTAVEVDFVAPNTLDAAYNRLGMNQNTFVSNYTFSGITGITKDGQTYNNPSSLLSPSRISVNPVWFPAPARNYFSLNIGNQVLPGEYIITGQCTSSDVTKPVVTVQIKLTVTGTNIQSLVKETTYWDDDQAYGIINGLNLGNNWQLNANLWNYWDMAPTTSNLPAGSPNTSFVFSIAGSSYPGITISNGNLSSAQVLLNAAVQEARNRVNGGDVDIIVTTNVNGAFYKSQTFPVKFKNPVKPVTVKANYRDLTDKENTSDNTSKFHLARSIEVKDFNGATIFGHSVSGNTVTWTNNATLKTQYDITSIGSTDVAPFSTSNVQILGAYAGVITNHVGKTPMTLVNATATFDPATNNVVWTNNGANIQQAITIVAKVTITNKWNQGGSDDQASEVVKYVYIKVNKSNN